MIYEELSAKILEACFEVSNELGAGYVESVYEQALIQKQVPAVRQVPLNVTFRGAIVGEFRADMIIDGKILMEIKAVDALVKAHYAQVLNYLKTTGMKVGMVINFGCARLQYRRFENRFDSGPDSTGLLQILFDDKV